MQSRAWSHRVSPWLGQEASVPFWTPGPQLPRLPHWLCRYPALLSERVLRTEGNEAALLIGIHFLTILSTNRAKLELHQKAGIYT